MTNSSKIRAVAAAAGACAALFASLPANAYVYAVSRLEIKNLDIGIFAANTTNPDVGAATNYSFSAKTNATYTPPGGSTLQDGYSKACSGVAGGPCGGNSGIPVLDVKVANAPGLVSARAENNFAILGSNATQSFSNADSQITTAKLVQGVKTSTVQIAESLLNVNGIADANTETKSNTTLRTDFRFNGVSDLYLNFDALLDLMGSISDGIGGFYTSEAHSNVTFTLLDNNGTGKWTWQPDGTSNGCVMTGATGTSSCTETADGADLNGGGSKSGNPSFYDGSSGGFKAFGLKIAGLAASSYSLTLVANTTTYVDRTYVPEPGSLALVGLALAGLGFAGKRRGRK